MDELIFYKTILFWQKKATEALLTDKNELDNLEPGTHYEGKRYCEKKYEEAIENIAALEKALALLQNQLAKQSNNVEFAQLTKHKKE